MSSSVQIAYFVEPGFGENAYVVWVNSPGPCWIIDPGPEPSAAQVLDHLREHRLAPEAILLTHGHIDHLSGIPEVRRAFPDLPVYIADQEKAALTDPEENLSVNLGQRFSTGLTESRDLPPDLELHLDGSIWKVLDTSGHSPGGRSFYCPAAGIVIVGDALFQGSIGRTDFHHSTPEDLIRNIHEQLFTLPDDTKVLCGHGPATTIATEKRTNPFLQG
jgi:glyoxylase-like metal-dependent hydrolase (beta-lactamase superfamily II)